jgi:hypothetical protein
MSKPDLVGFANAMFQLADWPDGGDIDGFDFQDAAIRYGLLIPERRTQPCQEGCQCEGMYDPDEWNQGIQCYRRVELGGTQPVSETTGGG